MQGAVGVLNGYVYLRIYQGIFLIGSDLTELWSRVCVPTFLAHPVVHFNSRATTPEIAPSPA